MSRRKYEFNEGDKIKVLLWCARHCCLCGKMAGIGIEIAHLENRKAGIDNAIPLCFDCHAQYGHYNKKHPRGRKYSLDEMKARRDQVYDLHTSHLVSPIEYAIFQEDGRSSHRLPEVGFRIANIGDIYPVRTRVKLTCYRKGVKVTGWPESGHYNGQYLWNLNPGYVASGHFSLPEAAFDRENTSLMVRVDITLMDKYDRAHDLLPVAFIKDRRDRSKWYFEPCVEVLEKHPTMQTDE